MLILTLGAFLSAVLAAMGMGGGGIFLIFLTAIYDFPRLTAQGINLIYFIPVAAVALIIHTKNRLVNYKAALPLAATGFLGAMLGTYLAGIVSGHLLSRLFAILLVFLGVREMMYKKSDN